ncbi:MULTISPECIES: hypothetical protein [Methanosarcina]|uniref:Uncharacterized protein n=3 Tax=Methanosarcina barkeri TaxID=2208 RepID=A0A0E3QUV6_METBA|nr:MULTISPECIES: hypothetical protein [Methanosarcina]AKB55202.1 hypothetical protein MSBRM_2204 [Methanosarcina barkeri MS]AKB56724.1 hypothetical protein MSBR2_0208 [Methanosarcina barkeri 227]AKJ37303.1 hypothetical protein MCM1_0186 [Methanosarcina barkeri CM1]OED01064.1 hypothetical protein A9239_15190 [Methanosarcina sp. A14]
MDKKVIILSIAFAAIACIQHLITKGNINRETFTIAILSSIILAFYFTWFIPKLNLRKRDAYFLTCITLFVVASLNNFIEAYFFTDVFNTTFTLVAAIIVSLLTTLIQTALAIYILKPEGNITLINDIREHVKTNDHYVLRIIAASLVYFPVYLTFGLIISPFVIPIYTNPQNGLSVPSFSLMFPLELVRGAIYAIVLAAVFASLKKQKNLNFKVAATLLFIPGAFIPLLSSLTQANAFSQVAPYHMFEILGDSIVYGYIISRIFHKV